MGARSIFENMLFVHPFVQTLQTTKVHNISEEIMEGLGCHFSPA